MAKLIMIRHNRRRRPFHTVEVARPHVLNQRAIDRSLPIRVWPSQQRLLIDDNGRVVATFKGFKVLEKNNLSEKHDLNSNLSVKEERLGARQLLKGFGFMEKLYNRNATQSSAGGSGSTNNNSSTGIDDDACKEPSSNVAIPLSDMSLVSSTDLEKVEDEACCSICLCEYTTNDRLRILPCDHEYHAECIGKCLEVL
ncbi:hypothetical protein BGZ46_010395 [Entomortierella lignicola]|nr:hypothetical protein BGZ46_010395 [Entomortierella lignicola]